MRDPPPSCVIRTCRALHPIGHVWLWSESRRGICSVLCLPLTRFESNGSVALHDRVFVARPHSRRVFSPASIFWCSSGVMARLSLNCWATAALESLLVFTVVDAPTSEHPVSLLHIGSPQSTAERLETVTVQWDSVDFLRSNYGRRTVLLTLSTDTGPVESANPLRTRSLKVEPMAGIEPATDGLRNRCSTAELHWQSHSP